MRMEIRSAFQVARREWENISVSLVSCGDTGSFDLTGYIKTEPRLIRNLLGMERRLQSQDYFTREAAYVFSELGKEAGSRLGLEPRMADAFGSGYSWARTGWFDLMRRDFGSARHLEEHVTMKLMFYMLFYPEKTDFGWLFDSEEVIDNLRMIYDRFLFWQKNPLGYVRDVRTYKARIEPLREGLTAALDAGSGWC